LSEAENHPEPSCDVDIDITENQPRATCDEMNSIKSAVLQCSRMDAEVS